MYTQWDMLCAYLCAHIFISQTWCPASWDLHIELDSIHAQYGMAHMSEQVPCRNDASKCRQLTQLSQLQLPPAF